MDHIPNAVIYVMPFFTHWSHKQNYEWFPTPFKKKNQMFISSCRNNSFLQSEIVVAIISDAYHS
jgi:hypothetical protein